MHVLKFKDHTIYMGKTSNSNNMGSVPQLKVVIIPYV